MLEFDMTRIQVVKDPINMKKGIYEDSKILDWE